MKKKVALLITTMFLVVGCGTTDVSKKEYTIDEIGPIYEETQELFKEKTKYLTTEELYSENGYEIFKECSEETGLPINTEITLSGVKKNSPSNGINIVSDNNEFSMACLFPEETQNVGMFIEDGENIRVKGIISSEDKISFGIISDTEILLPSNIDITFNNNISEICDAITNSEDTSGIAIMGTVETIMTLDDFKEFMQQESMSIISNFDPDIYYFEKIGVLLSDENDDNRILFSYNEASTGELSIGENIAIHGYAHDLLHTYNEFGAQMTEWGMIDNIFEIYHFET